jgi:hypothetical protein
LPSSGLTYVAAGTDGYVVGELELGGLWDVDGLFDSLGDGEVAFDGYGDDSAGAGGDFLDIGEVFLVWCVRLMGMYSV